MSAVPDITRGVVRLKYNKKVKKTENNSIHNIDWIDDDDNLLVSEKKGRRVEAVKEEIDESIFQLTGDAAQKRIDDLEKVVQTKDCEYSTLRRKLGLVENDYLGKVESLKQKIEKMIEDFTDYGQRKEKEIGLLEDELAKTRDNFKRQKIEFSIKTEEVTNYQIKNENMLKLNNNLKQQYDELDKGYKKSAAAVAKNERKISQTAEELASCKTEAGVKIETLQEESGYKEEKINKLLVVLSRSEVSNKELKTMLKEKDVELKIMSEELKTNNTNIKVIQIEILENNSLISILEQRLFNCQIKVEDLTRIAETKEKVSVEKTRQLEKQLKNIVLQYNEKLKSKDQLLNEALVHKSRLSDEFKAANSKIMESDIKLRDKDLMISARDYSIKMSSCRIHELKSDFDKKMEEIAVTNINAQNNIRHELLVQQQEMKKQFGEELETLKQQLTTEKNRKDDRKRMLIDSVVEPERKWLRKFEKFSDIRPDFYSYKSAKPVLKITCLSSPGLCSPRKSVTRRVFPAFLNKVLEDELLDEKKNYLSIETNSAQSGLSDSGTLIAAEIVEEMLEKPF